MKCRICSHSNNQKTYRIKEMMFGTKDEFDYFQCSNCNCLQISEIPTNLDEYYPSSYYSLSADNSVFYRNKIKNLLKNLRDNLVLKIGKFPRFLEGKDNQINSCLRSLIPTKIKKNSRILDVGCGNGVLLFRLQNAGFKNLLGLDPYLEKDIKFKNLIIKKSVIKKIEQKFDLIMFHHVIEHLPNPEEILVETRKKMNQRSIVLIRIPVLPNSIWDKYGTNWVQLDSPRHLYIHSIKSITILAEKSGLKIDKVVYDSDENQFIGTLQYVNGIPLNDVKSYFSNKKTSMFSDKEIAEFKREAKNLNKRRFGDQVCLYLSKK